MAGVQKLRRGVRIPTEGVFYLSLRVKERVHSAYDSVHSLVLSNEGICFPEEDTMEMKRREFLVGLLMTPLAVVTGSTAVASLMTLAGCGVDGGRKPPPNTPLAIMQARGVQYRAERRQFKDPATGQPVVGTFVTEVKGKPVDLYAVDGTYPVVAADQYPLQAGWAFIDWNGPNGTVTI